jgi:hypothetical protein
VKVGMVNVSNGAINILVIAMNDLSILVFSNAVVEARLTKRKRSSFVSFSGRL